ncbi:MAG: GDSL-type esterase/lipase family protein [Bacteroidota bacterium]|nr:GDSL-type esterase/lipase family protein [Bacteroidota bacterium]
MKRNVLLCLFALFVMSSVKGQNNKASDTLNYLSSVKKELKLKYPSNRTINLIFHGHSVPSGYWHNSEVHTLDSYPHIVLEKLKDIYPYAVVNVITTSIGGEDSEHGQLRFAKDVLPYKPDVIFIDYALNDLGMGLERSKIAWSKMIEEALKENIKVILITPSPDQRVNILEPNNELSLHAEQIRQLAAQFHVGLADPFVAFQKVMQKEGSVKAYMSHVNHPNRKGHEIIADEIMKWFVTKE